MRIADLTAAMERLAPSRLAEDWDNVGLLVGDPKRAVSGPVLLTIDLTQAVLDEAVAARAAAILAYHPPLFHPLNRLDAAEPRQALLLAAIEARIAIHSPHTALDAAEGGVTDWLCDMLGPEPDLESSSAFGDRKALTPRADFDSRDTHKIVVFVPREHVERLRDGLSSIGAGRIGLYEQCSYMLQGSGTFRPGKGADPAIGSVGALETVDEIRLEMVCPASALGLASEIIRQFHPYDEPAWDVYALQPKPDRGVGVGRRLTLDQPATPRELAERLKSRLGVDAVKLAAATEDPISRVGLCPGSGASLLPAAMREGCALFITGEMRHHEALDAVGRGCSVILAGHTNTERGYLPVLARRLQRELSGVECIVSQQDRAPFRTL